MFNFSILLLTLLLLISQKILLLNEETLILFCFIIFCWVFYNRLKETIIADFLRKSLKIEKSLIDSLEQVEASLLDNIVVQKQILSISSDFKSLKEYFLKLNQKIFQKLTTHTIRSSQSSYVQKLSFTQRIEHQTAKLLALLLSKKLDKLIVLNHFYTKELKIKSFLCFHKISLREYFQFI